jgi:hypothetical protein
MDRKKRLVVIAVDLAMFLTALDSTVIGPAMPTGVAGLGGKGLRSWRPSWKRGMNGSSASAPARALSRGDRSFGPRVAARTVDCDGQR